VLEVFVEATRGRYQSLGRWRGFMLRTVSRAHLVSREPLHRQKSLPFGDAVLNQSAGGFELSADLDHIFDPRVIAPSTRTGIGIRCARSGLMQGQALGAVRHIITDRQDGRFFINGEFEASFPRLRYQRVIPDPVLQVPAVLKERPDIVLVVDDVTVLGIDDAVEETAHAIELIAVTGRAGPDVESASHGETDCRGGKRMGPSSSED
jgi:hypothetical protein